MESLIEKRTRMLRWQAEVLLQLTGNPEFGLESWTFSVAEAVRGINAIVNGERDDVKDGLHPRGCYYEGRWS